MPLGSFFTPTVSASAKLVVALLDPQPTPALPAPHVLAHTDPSRLNITSLVEFPTSGGVNLLPSLGTHSFQSPRE